MTQPAAEQLLNLADRAERGALTPDEAARLRDGINALQVKLAAVREDRDRWRDQAKTEQADRRDAEAALAALHQGEQPHDDERAVPTPAQWIWRWNRATPAERLDVAAHVLTGADRASRCVLENHPAQIEQLRQDLARKEAELATWRATVAALESGGPGTPRHRAEQAEAAIERVRAVLTRIEGARRRLHGNTEPMPIGASLGLDDAARAILAALDEHQEQT